MAKWIPMINCGYHSGDTPMAFQLSNIDHFDTEEECENWINDNQDEFAPTETSGGVFPYEIEE